MGLSAIAEDRSTAGSGGDAGRQSEFRQFCLSAKTVRRVLLGVMTKPYPDIRVCLISRGKVHKSGICAPEKAGFSALDGKSEPFGYWSFCLVKQRGKQLFRTFWATKTAKTAENSILRNAKNGL